ncbi:alkaline shock response membrane anchor protein AmaP [Streptosporangium sp. NPDC000396]|uniref:alkaline shock response membrane anchor protein AmaP n=1 Tax=Streptosporangium sp. NPDC000396 TaxID=3366185 RepID=UPI00367463D8
MERKTARGNRLGLLLTGLLLMTLGGLALARGARAFPQRWAPAEEPLVNGPVLDTFTRYGPWLWWALAAAGIVLALLGLRWLLVQGRRDRLGNICLEGGPGGVTNIHSGGVADAVAADISSHPAVLGASAAMVGTSARPAVRLRVVADENAPMSAICEQLGGVAIPHMRQALETESVPAVAQISLEAPSYSRRAVA